jgi:hypothetical protein
MIAADIIFDVAVLLNDEDNITYPVNEVIWAINDAQRLISTARPDSTARTVAFSLAADTKQSLPQNARLLIDVTRNIGSGKAIRGPIAERDISMFNPDWHNVTGDDVIDFIYNQQDPKHFFVYPKPSSLPKTIEIIVSEIPGTITSPSDSITVDDGYAPAITSWCCYRMLSKDSSSEPSLQRAESHKNTVFTILGMKSASDGVATQSIARE